MSENTETNPPIKKSKRPEIQSRVDTKKHQLTELGVPEHDASKLARDDTARGIVLERLREEVQHATKYAIEDELTGLKNRRWFLNELDRKIAETRRTNSSLFLIYFDIDNFKEFNTRYGHHGGDEILKLISQFDAREEEPICRYGGDEFVQLVNRNLTEEDICNIIQRYQAQMQSISALCLNNLSPRENNPNNSGPDNTSLSFGIAKYEGQAPELLIKQANLALHQAKQEKGQAWIHRPDNTIGQII